jgi:hypothetical protein
MVAEFATELIESRLWFDDQARFELVMPGNSTARRYWNTAFGNAMETTFGHTSGPQTHLNPTRPVSADPATMRRRFCSARSRQ